MQPAGATVLLGSDASYGLGKLRPTTGAHNHLQPSSSAESSESPRTGLYCEHVSTFNMPLDAPGISVLAEPAGDPATSVMAIKQGLSHLAPSQLAELQSMLRQQRLQRQQQDLLPLLPPPAAQQAPPALPAVPSVLTGREFPASAPGAAAAAANIMQQVASAATALANSSFAHDDAARVAFLQAAAAHLLMQHQQQYSAPAPAAAAAFPAMPEQQQQLQQQQQHPGVTSCKAVRNTARRSRGCFNMSALHDAPAMQQQPQHAAGQVLPSAADYEMAAAAHSSYGMPPHTGMAPAVRATLLHQLQQLAEAEQHQAARRSSKAAAAGGNQRKSGRARKAAAKRDWDATNNTSQQQQPHDTDSGSSGSPGPDSPHAAAAAEAAPARAGSADANNSSASGLAGLAATADAAAAALQQQQQPVVKRVRFALADDASMESDDEQQHDGSENGEAVRHVIVRRIGPRAQARKRMHKRSARRRRPQRAPLC